MFRWYYRRKRIITDEFVSLIKPPNNLYSLLQFKFMGYILETRWMQNHLHKYFLKFKTLKNRLVAIMSFDRNVF
jgi:hypothetical protein